MDEDVVDVEDAGVDGGRVDASEGQFLLWLLLAEISRQRSVDCLGLVLTENMRVLSVSVVYREEYCTLIGPDLSLYCTLIGGRWNFTTLSLYAITTSRQVKGHKSCYGMI